MPIAKANLTAARSSTSAAHVAFSPYRCSRTSVWSATSRQEKRLFSEKQIALLKQFAAQAVIAIENTRLLRELRASTEDLRESLQQQIATADVLMVISRSAFDLQTVLDTLVTSAAKLCGADQSMLTLLDGGVLKPLSYFGPHPEKLRSGNRLPRRRTGAP
jgi:hypothetical protein